MKKVRIIIVDDHEMVIQGLRALLSGQPDIEIIKTYNDGFQAINDYEALNPDIVLLDINMPTINGFETANHILNLDNEAKIIMLSMEITKPYMEKAYEEGVKGFVSKSAEIKDLIAAVKNVNNGGISFNYLEVA